MMEKMIALQQKRRSKKGGFTLVELIVVLVILAILAALLIPALTGYIDRAKEKSVIAETRQCVMAAQTLVDEEYAKVSSNVAIEVGEGKAVTPDAIKKLAEVNGTVGTVTLTAATSETPNKIATLEYTDGKTVYKCTYNNGEYTVANAK